MAQNQMKPLKIHLVRGNPSHLTKAEIKARERLESKYVPKADNVECPDWLDDEAKAHWAILSKELLELDLLTNVDVGALAICCDAYSKFLKAYQEIDKHGMLVTYTNKGGNKNVVPNPYVAIANKYSDIYKRYCADFGLTPFARLKLATPKDEPKPLTDFEKRFGDI
ncbi:phage terminase small subunit P27 family [Desulfosporosinus sp. FKB]|uniref:phage terminase small subunit P27 family n=1 Tax=Desulfosporosinus sp. FKB TaxID=1969835 RepID=UPI000B4A21E3|nr:phage terminase small subunit P27 family [Desulfosporosinus sp. FKB]